MTTDDDDLTFFATLKWTLTDLGYRARDRIQRAAYWLHAWVTDTRCVARANDAHDAHGGACGCVAPTALVIGSGAQAESLPLCWRHRATLMHERTLALAGKEASSITIN